MFRYRAARHEPSESSRSPSTSSGQAVVIEGNGEHRYHFNDKNLPTVFLHNCNSAMRIVYPSCRMKECRGCPSRRRNWGVIINQNNLSNARLSHWDLIHQAMLALMESPYPKSQEAQNLSSALQAYLHNPALQRWYEQRGSFQLTTLWAFYAIAITVVFLVMGFAVAALLYLGKPSLGETSIATLLVFLPLIWVGIWPIAAAIWHFIPIALKKLSDYPQEGCRELEHNLRQALENLPRGQQDAPLTPPPHRAAAQINAEIALERRASILSGPPSSLERAPSSLERVEVETRPCRPSIPLSHPPHHISLKAISALRDTTLDKQRNHPHPPRIKGFRSKQDSPPHDAQIPLLICDPPSLCTTLLHSQEEVGGIEEGSHTTQSLPTIQADPVMDLQVHRVQVHRAASYSR